MTRSREVMERCLHLPLFVQMTEEEQDGVVEALREAVSRP
jgi:dTDP-4-amino-4,6-dideoxygalactose transaminase